MVISSSFSVTGILSPVAFMTPILSMAMFVSPVSLTTESGNRRLGPSCGRWDDLDSQEDRRMITMSAGRAYTRPVRPPCKVTFGSRFALPCGHDAHLSAVLAKLSTWFRQACKSSSWADNRSPLQRYRSVEIIPVQLVNDTETFNLYNGLRK